MGIKLAVVKRIESLCKERGIAVNALANLAGLTPSTVYSMLDPKRKDIGVVVIKKLCDGLDMTIAEFFDSGEFKDLEQEIYE